MTESTAWRRSGLYVGALSLALIVVAQGTLLARIRFFGAQPDLLLVVVVCWSLLHNVSEGLLLAFLGGLAVDLIAGLPMGASSLALLPVALLGSVGRSTVFANHLLLPVSLVALATALNALVMLLIQQARGLPVDWATTALQIVLPAMVLNALLSLPVSRLLRGAGARMSGV